MDEATWLACTDPKLMLGFLGKASNRKDRLVLLACCRVQGGELSHERLVAALDAAERHADALLAASTLRKYKHEVARLCNALPKGHQPTPEQYAMNLVVLAVTPFGSAGRQPVPYSILFGIWDGDFSPRLERHLPAVLRDIVGNPFRLLTLSPAWQSPTVLSLAQAPWPSASSWASASTATCPTPAC
jgi:hypothetical protein